MKSVLSRQEYKAAIRIELPWPSRVLHPNAREHWGTKASATKKARDKAGWEAKVAGVRPVAATGLTVTATFSPPDKRHRDMDGMLSSIKAYLDGIADVIGVDDSKWEIVPKRCEPKRPGSVLIEIEVRP